MKVRKFHSEGQTNKNVTIRIQVESERELRLLNAMMHNTYKLQEIANNATSEQFDHSEVKHVADSIYIASLSN